MAEDLGSSSISSRRARCQWTGRSPADLPYFCAAIVAHFAGARV
jgi:hypothetical protein